LSFSFKIVRLYFFDDLLDEHSIDSYLFFFLSLPVRVGGAVKKVHNVSSANKGETHTHTKIKIKIKNAADQRRRR
jgi:hypothetical protein